MDLTILETVRKRALLWMSNRKGCVCGPVMSLTQLVCVCVFGRGGRWMTWVHVWEKEVGWYRKIPGLSSGLLALSVHSVCFFLVLEHNLSHHIFEAITNNIVKDKVHSALLAPVVCTFLGLRNIAGLPSGFGAVLSYLVLTRQRPAPCRAQELD